jgi:hypothetical protein
MLSAFAALIRCSIAVVLPPLRRGFSLALRQFANMRIIKEIDKIETSSRPGDDANLLLTNRVARRYNFSDKALERLRRSVSIDRSAHW